MLLIKLALILFSFFIQSILSSLNSMTNTCWLVKKNVLSIIEPIREGLRESYVKVWDATFLEYL